MINRSFIFFKSVIIIGIILSLGCSNLNQKIFEPKSNLDLTRQELCYINNKVLSYIIENNDLFFDSEYFTEFKFDKNKSYIMYQKMSDSILQENMRYIIDSMDKPSVKLIKNKIDVLNICNSTQMSAHFVDKSNQTNEDQLSATSKYKCLFAISDIILIGDMFYIFCEYSEYFAKIEEIEKSKLGFQFRKCQNNGFIRFENFLEWHSEMFGHQHVKYYDGMKFDSTKNNYMYYDNAGFYRTKIKNFECDIK